MLSATARGTASAFALEQGEVDLGPGIHEHELTVLQLGIGIFAEVSYWELMPVWYHLVFLALLVPATVNVAELEAALDEVIRSVQQQLDEDETKAFKKLRKRWLKSKDQLNVMSEDSH